MSDQIITVEAELVDAASRRVEETAAAFTVRRDEGVASTGRDETVAPAVSAPAQRLETAVVTVKTAARSAYTFCARAARRLHWFITVRAEAFAAVIESRVRAFLNNVFPKTGADILRQSAILNI